MKHILIFIGLAVSISAKCQWQLVDKIDYNHSSVRALYLQNSDTIFCTSPASDYQPIVASFDGGKIYTELFKLNGTTKGGIYHIRCIDPDTLLLVTDFGIIKTSLTNIYTEFALKFKDYDSRFDIFNPAVQFWNKDSGIIVASRVFTTHDGGKNWQVLKDADTAGNGVFCSGISSKRLLLFNSLFLKESTDNGKSWKTIANLLDWGYTAITILSAYPAMRFINDSTGFLTFRQNLYKTRDGGHHWDSIGRIWAEAGTGEFGDIYPLNENELFARVRNTKYIYYSADGGKTWKEEFDLKYTNTSTEKFYYLNDTLFFTTDRGKVYKRSKSALSVVPFQNSTDFTVKAYPNPVNDILIIEVPDFIGEAKIDIYDAAGRHIQTVAMPKANMNVDFSAYSNGLYSITLSMGKKINSFKVIKR